MNVSRRGLAFTAGWEGVRLQKYDDGGPGRGSCTIGVGHLIHPGPCDGRPSEAPFNAGLTMAQALDLFERDAAAYAATVERAITVPMKQPQFDALFDFHYNTGSIYDIAPIVNTLGDPCAQMSLYVHAFGFIGPLPALVRRRREECILYHADYPSDGGDALIRLNRVSTFHHGRALPKGNYLVNVDIDFPGVPADARMIRVEPFVRVGGPLVLYDAGSWELYAGQVLPPARTAQIDVAIGPIAEPPLNGARGFRLRAGGALTLDDLGIVGYSL